MQALYILDANLFNSVMKFSFKILVHFSSVNQACANFLAASTGSFPERK